MIIIDITGIAGAAISLVFACIGGFLIPLVRRLVSGERLASLRAWVRIAVAAAEQLYRSLPGGGETKKSWVREFLLSRGFTWNEAELDALIEAEVWRLKSPDAE